MSVPDISHPTAPPAPPPSRPGVRSDAPPAPASNHPSARSDAPPAPRPVDWRDHLLGLGLAVAYIAVLVVTAGSLAMSRDESFYVVAAERYAEWIELYLNDPSAALTAEAIDRGWSYNHEHPALIKTLFALSWMAHQRWDLFGSDSLAFRFPGMLTAGLLLWLIYIFGARAFGRAQGAFAALAFALLPRVFYHAHLDAFDVPITLMVTWVVYAYWRSLTRPRWAWMTGIAFGAAMATKHNAWIVPGVLGIHFIWMAIVENHARRTGEPRRLSLWPWWLPAMLVLGPAIFAATWPWLWHTTWPRVQEYVAFHTDHAYYNMAYFGKNYFQPPFPVSFPFVMTLFTVPLTTIGLALGGLVRHRHAFRPPFGAKGLAGNRELHARDPRHTAVLMLGAALAPMLVIALPFTPIFGGTKHWFPSYPLMVLFAGEGFVAVAGTVRDWLVARWSWSHRRVGACVAAVGGLLLAPGLVETAHSHPFGLSHYTYAAGGVPGAADYGMNRQFWGFTTGSVVGFLREHLPGGGTVWINDTTYHAWRMLQRDERLPRNIRPTGDMLRADYALVHHEHHFAEVEYQLWMAYGTTKPAHVLRYDGVPIVTIYENPR